MIDIIQLVAIISACWAIISGVGAWKREYIGKRKIEIAETALAAFFEVRDAITYIRNPLTAIGEGNSREKSELETADETRMLNQGYIVVERYNTKTYVFNKFYTIKYRFMAAFGKETDKLFNDTSRTVNKIFGAANLLTTYYWKETGKFTVGTSERAQHLQEMKKYEAIFWDMHTEEDEIKKSLSEILIGLESVTSSSFEEPMKLYDILTKKVFKKA